VFDFDGRSADHFCFLIGRCLCGFRVARYVSLVVCGQYIPTEYTVGLGEPVNAILSAKSDPQILIDQETNGGLRNYFLCVALFSEPPCLFWLINRSLCTLGHFSSGQSVWVNTRVRIRSSTLETGTVQVRRRITFYSTRSVSNSSPPSIPSFAENETAVIRYDYGDPSLGTCQETIQGGNHFRYWVQNGPQRNSSAVFMAVSYEHTLQRTCSHSNVVICRFSPSSLFRSGEKRMLMTCFTEFIENHLVILNGYNLGR
jgi:hypothetical protein